MLVPGRRSPSGSILGGGRLMQTTQRDTRDLRLPAFMVACTGFLNILSLSMVAIQ